MSWRPAASRVTCRDATVGVPFQVSDEPCPGADMIKNRGSQPTADATLEQRDRAVAAVAAGDSHANDDPRRARVHHLFEEQARRTPEAVAVRDGDRSLSYRELDRLADHLAGALRSLGVDRDVPVAVYLGRSLEYVVSALGILKAGGAYVPLDVDYPAERLRFMLSDSGARAIVSRGVLLAELSAAGLPVVDISGLAASRDRAEDLAPPSAGSGEDLAYIMYTSGSTGRPKGTAIPHRGIARLVRGQAYARFEPGERFLFLASPSFDASTFELWGPLLNGATCVVYPQEALDLARLEQAIRRESITCLWLTAGLFNHIIDQRPTVLAAVPHVLTGGDALSVKHVQLALELFPHLRLTNGYGPTETTTFACTYEIPRGATFPTGSVPIGGPIAHSYCRILDAAGQPTADGVPGELYLGGDGLALGYVNLPELTAERFVPDLQSSDAGGGRLYRTGDFARYLSDGTIEFLGRRDQQVKIRGFRVELAEIEAALGHHPEVQSCAVAARGITPGNKELIAYLVATKGASLCVNALRAWLSGTLPEYMLPTRFVLLSALPLTPNGKLDRHALQRLAGEDMAVGTSYAPACTDLERALVAIWQDVLRRCPVGVHDNFFDLGGHSLLAVHIVSRIHRELGVLLPTSLLFSRPTVRGLVGAIEDERRGLPLRGGEAVANDRAPLFLLGWYLGLDGLDVADRRQYVLPFGDFDRARESCRVDALAGASLQTLRSIQPHGPYWLAGYSLAGLVAFEVARRLRAEGEAVRLVAMIDTDPDRWVRRLAPAVVGAMGRLFRLKFSTQLLWARGWYYLLDRGEEVAEHGLGATARAVRGDLQRAWRHWRAARRRKARGAPSDAPPPAAPETEPARGTRPFGQYWAHRWAHSTYRLRPYGGEIALFTSQTLAQRRPRPGRGWAPLVPSVREYIIPGTHSSCVRAHKADLAVAFRRCLAELDGGEPAGGGAARTRRP